MNTALGHIRVLDLSRIFAGPWATQNLADLGAEVIKIERPLKGDDTRAWGPPFLKDAEGRETDDSAYFLAVNRAKKSVTLDISTPEGQEIVRKLAAVSDVVIENYKVGTLARYGLAWEDLQKINPRLVYCSITGFGQNGPFADLPGYDYVFQGMGGLMSLTGIPDGEPGGAPMKAGVAISDLITGMYASTAILAALEHRHISGKGQYIDLALLDCTVALSSYMSMNYFLSGKVPQRMGNAHSNMVPYQVFRCKDGNMIVAVGNDGQFARLGEVLGLEPDPRFATAALRVTGRAELTPLIEAATRQWARDDLLARLETAGIPAGPINTVAQAFSDPQAQHRGMALAMTREDGVTIPGVRLPIRFSRSPLAPPRPSPALGNDN